MHKNSWPIAKFTFVALLCLQSVTLVLMLLIAHLGGEEAYLKHVKRLMKAVTTESIQNVDNLLRPAENLVVTTASLMQAKVLPVAPNVKLEQYLLESIKINTNFSGIYFGWNNGDFLFVTRNNPSDKASSFLTKKIERMPRGGQKTELISRNYIFEETNRRLIDDTFDPRNRPWFKAVNKGAIRWTQPYIFHTSKRPGVSVSISVVNDEGEPLGVLGLDIELSHLSGFLGKNELSDNSLSLIATDDGRMVAYADLDLILKPNLAAGKKSKLAKLAEMEDQCINGAIQALKQAGLSFVSDKVREVEFQHEGEIHHAVFHSYDNPGVNWTMAVISPESDFIASIRKAQFWQIISAVIASLLITGVAFLVLSRFLKPVKALQEVVLRDSLTGLYSRRALEEVGSSLFLESRSKGQAVSIAIIDVDRFKVINDTFGHTVGDEVLVSVSQRMQHALKKTDLLVRYGGEEFVLLLPGNDLNSAKMVCERLKVAVNVSSIQTDHGGIPVTISIGVSEISPEDETYHPALDLADQALFAAKRAGRNRVCTPSDVDSGSPIVNL